MRVDPLVSSGYVSQASVPWSMRTAAPAPRPVGTLAIGYLANFASCHELTTGALPVRSRAGEDPGLPMFAVLYVRPSAPLREDD
jgi:hypothetical protein